MSADFWSGYISGAIGIVIGNPLDLIKTRLQAAPNVSTTLTSLEGFKGHFDNASSLVRGEYRLNCCIRPIGKTLLMHIYLSFIQGQLHQSWDTVP